MRNPQKVNHAVFLKLLPNFAQNSNKISSGNEGN